ncbi:MAG: hypothetical protein OEW21_15020 [Betaproteobacteria bacterium]|nr:hypothetical protein [Betaproteobacteria bacterium]
MGAIRYGLAAAAALFVLATAARAGDGMNSRLSVEFHRDADGKLSPSTFLPLTWAENWFSGIGFRDSTEYSTDKIAGIPESRFATTLDDRRLRLNLISYVQRTQRLEYSAGADLQRIDIEKNEFGYFHLVLPAPAINDWIAFDNRVKIADTALALRGDVTLGEAETSPYLLRLGAHFTPSRSLKVTQETEFQPLLATPGRHSASLAQKPTWELALDARLRVNERVSVGLDARYEMLPLKYEVAQLRAALDGFDIATIDTTETTTRLAAKLVFRLPGMSLNPLIGYARESVKQKDNLGGASTETRRNLVILGVTGMF